MKEFKSILIIIPVQSPRLQISRLVRNAMPLALWLKCEAHFLASPSEMPMLEREVSAYRRASNQAPLTLLIRSRRAMLGDALPEVLREHSCDLVVIEDSVLLNETKGVDERAILERSLVPVLLIPRDINFMTAPPNGFLVPLSGERRASEAASVSFILARQTHSSVDFLHVTNPEEPCACSHTMEALGDQLHHEYRQMIDKIASEASPYSTPEERSHIRLFHHCQGLTSEEIASVLKDSPSAILVLEWKGTLATGRATTIKKIVRQTHHPILFVKESKERKSTLRVGKDIDAA